MKKHRTVFITRHTPLPKDDGAGAYVCDLLHYLSAKGIDVHVVWIEPPDHIRWQGWWKPDMPDCLTRKMHIPRAWRFRGRFFFPDIYWQPFKARNLGRLERLFPALKRFVRKHRHATTQMPAPDDSAQPGEGSTAANAPSGWMALPAQRHFPYIKKLCRRLRPDSVIANYAWMTPLFPEDHKVRRICMQHDVAWKRALLQSETDGAPPKITASQEASLLAKAEVIATISQQDLDELTALVPGKNMVLARKAFTLNPPAPATEPDTQRLLFVGSGNTFNYNGLHWFLESCWPRLRQSFPGLTLDVVGMIGGLVKNPPAGVAIHGRVESVTPYYHQATVCIVPMLQATGFNIKLGDALSHGCAVVATEPTRAGASFIGDAAIFTPTEPSSFCQAVTTLLANPDHCRELRTKAIESARQHLDHEAAYKAFYHSLVD